MDETRIEMPTSWRERLAADKRCLALFVLGLLVLIGGAGVLLAAVLQREAADVRREVPVGVLDPVAASGGVGDATGGVDASGGSKEPTSSGTGSGGTGATGGGPGGATGGDGAPIRKPGEVPVFERAPYIAYRLDGAVWVAREDGTQPRQVAASAEVYELSPDGTKLAIIDRGELALVNVGDGSRIGVGPALVLGLAWHPDSSELYFVRDAGGPHGDTDVLVVGSAGGTPGFVARGEAPAVGPDGTVVALPPSESIRVGRTVEGDSVSGSLLLVPAVGHARTLTVGAPALACAVFGSTIVYSVSDIGCLGSTDPTCEPDIRVLGVDGTGEKRLVDPPTTLRPFGYAELMISPDGKRLLFAETGDDGYSRAWVVSLSGGRPVPLTIRRSTYPVGWSADGERVFFVEGNAFQGERTALYSARYDGVGRRMVVEGASR
ncbi:MAG: PD40 domain-containing protein [Clostridiales bacterium]|nr:PD40 domain-containing protein [Clostridiales bacterium]